MKFKYLLFITSILFSYVMITGCQRAGRNQVTISENDPLDLERITGKAELKNVIFVLSDDHRYDFMGFTGKVPWLKMHSLPLHYSHPAVRQSLQECIPMHIQ